MTFNSKTEFVYLRGKCKWARVRTPDVEYKQWNITLYLDQPSYSTFLKLKESTEGTEGILNEVKKDDEGYYVILRRPLSRIWNGRDTLLTPPVVLDKDNKPFSGDIGNGSDVTVKIEVYAYNKPFKKGKGKAIRLNSVRVEELVTYSRDDYSEEQSKMAEGFDTQHGEQHF